MYSASGWSGRISALLEVAEDGQFLAAKRGLETVGEANTVGVPVVGRGLDDDADSAARMDGLAIGAPGLDESDDLGADGEDQVRIGVIRFCHG